MWSSPSQSPSMPVAMLLISTAATRSRGSAAALGARSWRTPARVSWSDKARTRIPASAATATSSAGSRMPSERQLWGGRSTRGDNGGITRGPPMTRDPRRNTVSPATSDLDDPLNAFNSYGASCGRVDVDHAGVEYNRPGANLKASRQSVQESRNDRVRIEPDDTVDRPDHAQIGLVGRALGHDPLVGGGHVGVRPDDRADPAVEVDTEGVLLAGEFAVEVQDANRRKRLGSLLNELVELCERVLDGRHVRSALEVQDRNFPAVHGLEG